ncbi:MAG: PhoPQ-activated pathogenicity-like protein PqaA type [Thalassobius sp.]|nr:PhoPQ-activated pathogenicity-like protein PqaA type [Thalassovita sp.]
MSVKHYFIFLILVSAFVRCSSPQTSEKEVTEETKDQPVTAETALQSYLNNGDTTYKWEVIESYPIEGAATAYDLKLTSQNWRDHIWTHQLTILVPEEVNQEEAMLFITGGSIKDGEPNYKSHTDDLTVSLAFTAKKTKAICSIIRQTPNQPLYDGLVEDQLISFTLHNFKNDGDFTWPLLFPMVKTAVTAMDAVQEFSKKELSKDISEFVVSGASKRGWTTWLTGANDSRVKAIAPMVIDVLNMPVSLQYQIEVWQEYSVQIEDYVKLEIPQTVQSKSGSDITTMVDPYSYRDKLTMPKMIFNGTNDEYWPVDAIKNYLDSIPGKNYLQYVPNAGHGLGDKKQAFQALSSFFATTIMDEPYPTCTWDLVENNGKLQLKATATPELLQDVLLWSAVSEDRDFRDEKWSSESLHLKNIKDIETQIDYPQSGFKAFYLDLKYKDPLGDEYVESTRMFVTDSLHVF